jgi:hypothetical protein
MALMPGRRPREPRTKPRTTTPARIELRRFVAYIFGPPGLLLDAVVASGVPWSWDGPLRCVVVRLEYVADMDAAINHLSGKRPALRDLVVRR